MGLRYFFKKEKPTKESIVSISSGFLLIITQVILSQLIFMPLMFYCYEHRLFNQQIGLSMWLQAIVLTCFCQWLNHFLYHKVRFLWCFHVVHHSAEHLNFNTAIRNSAIDIVPLDLTFMIMPLLGVQPVLYYIIYSLYKTWGMFLHISEDYLPNKEIPFLKYIIATPMFHRVHHSCNPIYIDKNYSETLPVLDILFGTYQKYSEPFVFGVAKNKPIQNLKDVHLHEFRRLKQDINNTKGFYNKLKIIFGPVY